MSFTVVAFAATIFQPRHNFLGEPLMHPMAQNHFEHVRSLLIVQKYAHLNVALFQGLTVIRNDHVPYDIQRFAVQSIYLNLQYMPRSLEMRY